MICACVCLCVHVHVCACVCVSHMKILLSRKGWLLYGLTSNLSKIKSRSSSYNSIKLRWAHAGRGQMRAPHRPTSLSFGPLLRGAQRRGPGSERSFPPAPVTCSAVSLVDGESLTRRQDRLSQPFWVLVPLHPVLSQPLSSSTRPAPKQVPLIL